MRSTAHESSCSVGLSMQSMSCEHIGVYEDMARGNTREQFPHREPIVLGSSAGGEDI